MGDRDEKNRAVSQARDFNPFRAEFLDHEFETYDQLREHLPIARSESMVGDMISGNSGGWVLTRYADAGEVLRNTADFSSQSGSYPVRPWIPQAVDPPMHTAYRRILNPWFTADAMAKLEPHLIQYAEELVDRMLAKDAFDFVAEFADPFPTVIFCELAGFPAADYPRIMDWKNTIMHASDGHTRGRELARARASELGLDLGDGAELPTATSFAVRARAAQEVYGYLAGLLEERRAASAGPAIVVVPKSLVFNWQQEAARFTPQLRLLKHTGIDRKKGSAHFQNYDLIITTYGTLRRDAVQFQDAEFDFVILDEAQAIKNARTGAAKAARLLKGKHRLALSGTPIENHLGELWSLFEFLNPGMLGAASVFQLSTSGARAPDDETRALLARALRPFLLRRTKQQVAKELPEKLEQTIYCEMDVAQRKQYDELRDYYRASLLEQVGRIGINRAKIQILEALLRLRQTACHPALVTGGNGDEPSAKLDVLMPQLGEVTEEGHKALVFSQFTSFLAIVRRRLDLEGIDYEYLDGKTSRRDLAVERFQNDPKCKLFLISLKAGGQGLNLTAAEYVFLLDPWWNPAVEAQAIDRAHRIGQAQRVFAYRLITRDTVEEKVLALQATKRELADAILNADNSLIRNITGEDLMLLLS